MQIEVLTGIAAKEKAEALVIGMFEGAAPRGVAQAVDAALGGQLSRLIERKDFSGKSGDVLVLYPDGKIPALRVIVAGFGKAERIGLEVLRKTSATAMKKARDLGATVIHTSLHADSGMGGMEASAEAVVEGAVLGLYRFRELKTDKPDRADVHRLVLVVEDPSKVESVAGGAKRGQVIAESSCYARDLANLPGNVLSPVRMGEIASNMAGTCGLKVTVLDETEIARLGMNAVMSVGKGSHQPPRFIVLEHNASRADLPCVVLVGKAVTFDSGGISLKPGDGMEAMKGDMAGGAAVFGAMRAVALLALPLRVVGLVPAAENMPGGGASRPGDVVRALNGLTIEIISTDAEGRMLLADGLAYSGQWKPSAVFDIATLTGACVVALGSGAAGVMGDEELCGALSLAGDATGERVWELPLYDEYNEQIKSDVADVKNSGGRPAGALTAGCFLKKFVPEGTRWVHIDMAGMSREGKGTAYVPKGATGYGVRLFVDTLRNWLK